MRAAHGHTCRSVVICLRTLVALSIPRAGCRAVRSIRFGVAMVANVLAAHLTERLFVWFVRLSSSLFVVIGF